MLKILLTLLVCVGCIGCAPDPHELWRKCAEEELRSRGIDVEVEPDLRKGQLPKALKDHDWGEP